MAVTALFLATGCGSSVRVVDKGDTCSQVRKKTFLGIKYSQQEAVVRCPNE